MSRAKVVGELIKALAKQLKMPGLARNFEALARQAEKESWSFEDYLHEVLSSEVSSRNESAVKHRLAEAHFPETKTLDTFDMKHAEGLDAKQIALLAKCDYIDKRENVVLAGPIGTGKTHLAIALGVEAARQRRHVLFFRAADLVQALVEAKNERELSRLQRRLARSSLLIVDELGFVPFDRQGGELLFNIIAGRYEKRSVIVTTNLSFAEWPKVFADDEKLTTALLDRLVEHASLITTRGKSYRMRRRKEQPTDEAT